MLGEVAECTADMSGLVSATDLMRCPTAMMRAPCIPVKTRGDDPYWWLELSRTCTRVFERTGELWEKYDVVRQRPSHVGRYPTQIGFGWTNAVYVKLVEATSTPTGCR